MVRSEGSHLKRARHSVDAEIDPKKPRRSERLSQRIDSYAAEDSIATEVPTPRQHQLPTPMTFLAVDETPEHNRVKEPTATPPGGGLSQVAPSGNTNGDDLGSHSSPPQDTQAMPSQYLDPNSALSDEVKDEVKEGVWGYLLPMGARYGSRSIVMKRRAACTDGAESSSNKKKGKKNAKSSPNGASASGYLIGRHPECDVVLEDPIVSNRHCLIFAEHKGHDTVAVLEDLSSNGTFVNEALVGRNQRLELIDAMLAVDPEHRYTIDECIAHPWMNESAPSINDSTDGLVGGVAGLAVGRRGITRERTLLSALNRVEVTNVPGGANYDPVKIFSKTPGANKEPRPADNADPGAFMEHGERGDPELYGNERPQSTADISKDKAKTKGKGKSKR
ncbi:serine threonine-protein kinase chk2 [Ophiostoma piceae UAMH 11346]|uniref:Serine threonine-protein kinase chk2 n=1 Tax=Ophiostoma piceae (strain UAMH 11346) TaxID=1262450 RepID=S3BRP3_OPHP1|nr:serine threonine-protein kinase chk2 [Ophiostoma piceae UAMH 11346]